MPYQVYLSTRGLPLLYMDKPLDVPVVTLENYTKWYDIYVIYPDGSVKTLAPGVISSIQDDKVGCMWIDHLYHPRLLYRVAEYLKGTVDERAVEVAAGRWIIESLPFETERFKFHDPDLS